MINWRHPPHHFPLYEFPSSCFDGEYGYRQDFGIKGAYSSHYHHHFYTPYNINPHHRIEFPSDEMPIHHKSEKPYCDEIESSHPYYKPRSELHKLIR